MKIDLTPDERMIRDHYLSEKRTRFHAFFFDVALIGFSLIVFTFGYLRCEGDGVAMLIVGYALALYGLARYLYHGFVTGPYYRSLIRKYEAALGTAEAKAPNQPPEPTVPSGRGPP